VVFLEKRKGRFIEQSFFLSEMIENVEEIRFLFPRLEPDKLKELLSALADYLSRIQSEGILHRDLSDGNILVKRDGDVYVFYFIDTNRIREKRKVGTLSQIKSLVRLGIPRDFQKYFLGQHFKTDKTPTFIWFWYRFNKVRFTWIIELKKKLHLKQIAKKLKIQ
jgi:serine/threonine protein kinase